MVDPEATGPSEGSQRCRQACSFVDPRWQHSDLPFCLFGLLLCRLLNLFGAHFTSVRLAESWSLPSFLRKERLDGKVIGEFICDHIMKHCEMANADIAEQQSRVKRGKILEYANGKEVYGWHISDLVIYDKPRELCEFYRHDNTYDNAFGYVFEDRAKSVPLKRPPQSWCYVETDGGSDA